MRTVLALYLAFSCAPCAFSGVIEMKTGQGDIGTMDPLISVSTNWGSSFQDAYIVEADPEYETISGTRWISVTSDRYGGPEYSSNILFRAVFDLPDGYSSPSFTISVHADNSARVFLNGVLIGEQPWHYLGYDTNFKGAPEEFWTTNAALFQAGENVLDIQLWNGMTGLGLDYDATVSFIPEPAHSMLALILLAVVCSMRTARRRAD